MPSYAIASTIVLAMINTTNNGPNHDALMIALQNALTFTPPPPPMMDSCSRLKFSSSV